MSSVVFLHVFAVAFWLGCVAVEVVVEQVGLRREDLRAAVSQFHFYVDRFVEIPAITVVLLSGLWLFEPARFVSDGLYTAKVIAGLLAVGANIVSIHPVIMRKRAADDGDRAEVRRHGTRLNATVPVGVPAAVSALAIGGHFAGLY
ncbi:MAG: hypothetical protein ABF296_04355 [Oceanococcaceae bacterium]